MLLHVTRPTDQALAVLAQEGAGDELTYSPVGMSALEVAPAGYRRDRWVRAVGHGDETFGEAAEVLMSWGVHRGAGLTVHASGRPQLDSVVAMAAPLPFGFVSVVCRVVDVIDEPSRRGFTYGTLSAHPERGEEAFVVELGEDGAVNFEVAAMSRPRHLLARACPPVARLLQRAATDRYLSAMQSALHGG
jgi:uncharacterized protein (UPF0548 family)